MSEIHAPSSIPTKILLPIDFSPSSQAALEMAADLALHFQAKLYLVNVIPMFPTTTIPDLIPESEFIQEKRTFAESHLARLPRRWSSSCSARFCCCARPSRNPA